MQPKGPSQTWNHQMKGPPVSRRPSIPCGCAGPTPAFAGSDRPGIHSRFVLKNQGVTKQLGKLHFSPLAKSNLAHRFAWKGRIKSRRLAQSAPRGELLDTMRSKRAIVAAKSPSYCSAVPSMRLPCGSTASGGFQERGPADDLHRSMVLSLPSLVVSLSGCQRQSARRLAISWAACTQPDGRMTDAPGGMKDEKSRALSSNPRALCDERERAGAGHDLSQRCPGRAYW